MSIPRRDAIAARARSEVEISASGSSAFIIAFRIGLAFKPVRRSLAGLKVQLSSLRIPHARLIAILVSRFYGRFENHVIPARSLPMTCEPTSCSINARRPIVGQYIAQFFSRSQTVERGPDAHLTITR